MPIPPWLRPQAAVFEFAGALVLGRVTTSVIAGGIANISTFYDVPEVGRAALLGGAGGAGDPVVWGGGGGGAKKMAGGGGGV
jgi:hypothetical protein